MVRLHIIKPFTSVYQNLVVRLPRLAPYLPVAGSFLPLLIGILYVQLSMHSWLFADQFFFKDPDSILSGALAFITVIIPASCLMAISLVLLMNEFLILELFETRWQRFKAMLVGVVFLVIGSVVHSMNTAVFKALGPAFDSSLGTFLGLLSLSLVTTVCVICCWPTNHKAVIVIPSTLD